MCTPLPLGISRSVGSRFSITLIEGYSGEDSKEVIFLEYTAADNEPSINVALSDITGEFDSPDSLTRLHFTLMADGNEYVTVGQTEIELNI